LSQQLYSSAATCNSLLGVQIKIIETDRGDKLDDAELTCGSDLSDMAQNQITWHKSVPHWIETSCRQARGEACSY